MSEPSPNPPAEPAPSESPTPTPQATATPSPTQPEAKPTLLNEPEPEGDPAPKPAPEGAPDKYEDFKLPEGYQLEAESLTKATDLFKGLGLSQTQAQSLVDFHIGELTRATTSAGEASEAAFRETVEGWGASLKADPEIGGKLTQVKADLGKAYDVLIAADPTKSAETRALVNEFKSMMDLTGAGNHPAFVKVFHRLAQRVIEPGHVAGRGPSAAGQSPAGTTPRPSVAQSMYPNNPTG